MHQHAAAGDIVNVIDLDFQVVNDGRERALDEGEDGGFAVERGEAFAHGQFIRANKRLAVERVEGMVAGGADRRIETADRQIEDAGGVVLERPRDGAIARLYALREALRHQIPGGEVAELGNLRLLPGGVALEFLGE